MSDLKVEVKSEHIATGECASAQKCMIAAAIKAADPTATYVAVRTNGITITHRNKKVSYRRHYLVPLKAARRIVAFDAGEPVAPFSFVAAFVNEISVRIPTLKQRNALKVKEQARRDERKASGDPIKYHDWRKSRISGV